MAAADRQLLLKRLRLMKKWTPLLKFGQAGKPKFRSFRLSDDNTCIEWEGGNKSADQRRIVISSITEIRFGQRTPKFKRNNRKDLEHLSFSIIYQPASQKRRAAKPGGSLRGFEIDGESLDLVCKDDSEFEVWAETLVAFYKKQIDASMLKELNMLVGRPSQVSRVDSANHMDHHHKDAGAESNDVYSFGWGEWGQTGNSKDPDLDANSIKAPRIVEALLGKGVIQIACGWSHTTVLLESGAVLQCGNRLGTGLYQDHMVPKPTSITSKLGVISVSCGAFHTLALTERGEVIAWGCNFHGQLGQGDKIDSNVPKVVKSLTGKVVEKIAAGGHSTMALDQAGSLYTWGHGAHGCLGQDTDSDEDCLLPQKVKSLDGAGITKIACGQGFMFACTDTMTYSWGLNSCGQLGLGHEDDQPRPQSVDALRSNRVLDISCGAGHVVAVVNISKVDTQLLYTWGSNAFGQLGQRGKTVVNKPTPVVDVNNRQQRIVEVACGDLHSVLRTEDGRVYGCGSNSKNQIGLDKPDPIVPVFTVVPAFNDKNTRSIQCGGQHTCALTARKWVADDEVKECMLCKNGFNMVRRRHHCRNCFGVFCNDCSSKKAAILSLGLSEPQRVCDTCYVKLRGDL